MIDASLYQTRDDGVITMSAGRNLVDFGFVGVSPSGPIVEASSSPVQMILYAATYAMTGINYASFAFLQTLVATLLLGAAIALALGVSRAEGLFSILLLSLALSFVYPFFLWHGSGMENALTHFLIVLSIAGLVRMIRCKRVSFLWAIPLVLTCFVRLELLLTIVALLGLFSVYWQRKCHSFRALKFSFLVAALCVVIHGIRFAYFGEFFPNTAAAQGISPLDRAQALLSGSVQPMVEGMQVSAYNFVQGGWWLAVVCLPLVFRLGMDAADKFLISAILVVLCVALISPVFLGRPRIDWMRTYSYVTVVSLLLPTWCVYHAVASRRIVELRTIAVVGVVASVWMYRTEPYYLGWAVDGFDQVRREFNAIAQNNEIRRPLVSNPDLGVMSWHKQFNILDLGMLGSPVMANLHKNPGIADYVLDFTKPDIVESHGFWTGLYCRDLFQDARFKDQYRSVSPKLSVQEMCGARRNEKAIWIRKSIELGSSSAERQFLDRLQDEFLIDTIKQELDLCDPEKTDCRYVMRTVFRFVPELMEQRQLNEVLSLFDDDIERAYLSSVYDNDATDKITNHFFID